MSTNAPTTEEPSAVRRGVYLLLIALAIGNATGRILAVNSTDTVRLEAYRIDQKVKESDKRQQLEAQGISGKALDDALADEKKAIAAKMQLQRPFLSSNDRSRWVAMRAIVEYGTFNIDEVIAQPNWDTIDMVKHANRAGEMELYSSKPPLMATLYAIPYWVIVKTTGATLGTHPYEVGRALLILFNVVPLVVLYLVMGRLIERLGRGNYDRLFAMATITLATFLTTFITTLNNHLPGAVAVAIALDAIVRIADGDQRWRWFILGGLFSAYAVTCELPALAFLGLAGAVMLFIAPKRTLIAFLPAALLVAAAFFVSNKVIHDSWRMPYAHRNAPDDDWYRYTYVRNGKEVPSYWNKPSGIDIGEPSQGRYAVHALVGHHGIFSLTPVWMFSFAGMLIWIVRGDRREKTLGATLLLLSLVCVTFYILRPQVDRNYGGMTSGFRWVFWFAPLWTVAMLPTVAWLARWRWGRIFAAVLLGFSALSVSYPTWNPWTHPWLTQFWRYLGWESF